MSNLSFDWLSERAAGVLLHPTCFPNDTGVGTLGAEARRFVDFVEAAGLAYWQVCPLGPTGFGDSPYQCFSAFAGNPYLIDPMALIESGLLLDGELAELRQLSDEHTDYGGLYHKKWPVLEKAWKRFKEGDLKAPKGWPSYKAFKSHHASWLNAYATFMALKGHFEGQAWQHWPRAYRTYKDARKQNLINQLDDAIEALKFYQYCFFTQWQALRSYANERGVQIIGDIPIFVSMDSADIWANPELFQVDERGKPLCVAGVPPDYFSETGQLWGNPLYDWHKLRENRYEWWMKRFELNFELFDVVRLDHFRGFYDYWKIPADAPDARSGQWADGPQHDFFETIYKRFGKAPIIAEDLGENLQEVFRFRDELSLPGMAILQFAYYGDPNSNPYVPEKLKANSVVYPGTHDNDTTRGWWENENEDFRNQFRQRTGKGEQIARDFIEIAYQCESRLAIVALQDYLNLDSSGRFNTPGEAMGNWQWRYNEAQLEALMGQAAELKQLAQDKGRLASVPAG